MDFFRSIKYFWQRGVRGYSDEDIWDFNSYLCGIIPTALRKMRKDGYGCPSILYDKKRENDECHKWHEILEAISQGFESAEFIQHHKYLKFTEMEDGGKILKHDYGSEKNAIEKMDKGLELFAKYFINLWD